MSFRIKVLTERGCGSVEEEEPKLNLSKNDSPENTIQLW